MVAGEDQLLQVVLWPAQKYHGTHYTSSQINWLLLRKSRVQSPRNTSVKTPEYLTPSSTWVAKHTYAYTQMKIDH